MRRTIVLLPAAIILTLATSASPASGAASRPEYVAQAEPICTAVSADITSLTKRFRHTLKHGSDKAAGKLLKQMGDVFGSSISKVRQITPPPGDEQTISEWLAMMDQIASNAERMGKAQAQHRIGTRDSIYLTNQKIGSNAIALVNDWGFQACTGSKMPALGPIPQG